jgi:hypothetical protein
MAFPTRPALSGPQRSHPSRIRRWVMPTIGAVTPTALIIVNIAVFIAKHLDAFRWSIAVLAFVSGMMLNSWSGLNIYRVFQRRYGHHPLLSDVNQDFVLLGGMVVIIGISFVTALFCYLGLSNEANLPNAMTFLTGLLAIVVPFALKLIFDRVLGRGSKVGDPARPVAPISSPLPPPPPPPPLMGQASERGLERRR